MPLQVTVLRKYCVHSIDRAYNYVHVERCDELKSACILSVFKLTSRSPGSTLATAVPLWVKLTLYSCLYTAMYGVTPPTDFVPRWDNWLLRRNCWMKNSEITNKERREGEAFILKVWFELLTYTPKYATRSKECTELHHFTLQSISHNKLRIIVHAVNCTLLDSSTYRKLFLRSITLLAGWSGWKQYFKQFSSS